MRLSQLAAAHSARGGATALIHDGGTLTYLELCDEVDALAAAMRADRLAGTPVALMLPNSPALVTSYLACFAAGAIAAPLNRRYAAPEVERALRRIRPRWLLVHADRLELLARVDASTLADVRLILVGAGPTEGFEAYRDVLDSGRGTAFEPDVAPDEAAVVFLTSGSTGQPKGVVHSHNSALAMLTSTSEALGDVRADDVVQVFEPLVHVSGFIATFTTLLAGGTVVLYDGFDIDTYAHALRTHRPTLICTHIDVLAQLLHVDGVCREWFSSLRGVYTGGDTVPARLQQEFMATAGLPIGVGYGMTEAIWLTVQRAPRTNRDGCIGRPVRGVHLRIDDATGEVLVCGPMVMKGYWEDDALTASTLIDGWFRTGDLAEQDDDGVWWFTGRIKDVIVRRTSKITPGEVEAALEQHPSVELAAVVGAPDAEEGQVPVAFVVPRAGATLAPDELVAFLSDRIAAYKIPVRLHLRSALPLTPSGKISRRELVESA
ncbi:class I adenylate-forming enzyme family protein [Mycolicibacterium agri]|nr:class I adenylate-forming enzyme family protein [Mycolicibacterium agri]